MDYSGRVNSKKGAGGVAGAQETQVHTRKRVQELLSAHVVDLENDPYVIRNQLGMLECRLCLTTHVSEASYISHLGGRKHRMGLERRQELENRGARTTVPSALGVSISAPKRAWDKIGRPAYHVTKVRHPESLQMGVLVQVELPKMTVKEPFFRFLLYYELSAKNQNVGASFFDKNGGDAADFQYLVISGEPYENVAFAVPKGEIDRPEDPSASSESYWWHWDDDKKEFFMQFFYKPDEEEESKGEKR